MQSKYRVYLTKEDSNKKFKNVKEIGLSRDIETEREAYLMGHAAVDAIYAIEDPFSVTYGFKVYEVKDDLDDEERTSATDPYLALEEAFLESKGLL